MKYCSNCGVEVNENQNVCLKCGVLLKNQQNQVSTNDTGSIGWGFLGFFFPIIGLILYIVWKDTQPLNAKSAGKGALISFIIGAVLVVIWVVIAMVFINSFTYYPYP